jgi:hypothetical protein
MVAAHAPAIPVVPGPRRGQIVASEYKCEPGEEGRFTQAAKDIQEDVHAAIPYLVQNLGGPLANHIVVTPEESKKGKQSFFYVVKILNQKKIPVSKKAKHYEPSLRIDLQPGSEKYANWQVQMSTVSCAGVLMKTNCLFPTAAFQEAMQKSFESGKFYRLDPK